MSENNVVLAYVPFYQLQRGMLCSFSAARLETIMPLERRQLLAQRLSCLMQIVEISRDPLRVEDNWVGLRCVTPRNRILHSHHQSLVITKDEYAAPPMRYLVSPLLEPRAAGHCHMCCAYNEGLFVLSRGHAVCPRCRSEGRTLPPFPFGRGQTWCCQTGGCGTAVATEEEEFLLQRALNACEKHYAGVRGGH